MKKNRALASWCFLLLVLSLLAPAHWAAAQQRRRQQTRPPSGTYLPRAGFPTYGMQGGGGFTGGLTGTGASLQSSGGQAELPVVNGLHLQEGLERREGSGNTPYDPGEEKLGMAMVRWDHHRFPLKVWISEGKKLPEVPWAVISDDRVPRVCALLASAQGLDSLPCAPGWKPMMNDAAAAGFEEWRQDPAHPVDFGFVDDPHQADICVFFTDHFIGSEGPGGTSVHGQTYGQVFTTDQYVQKLKLRQPSVPVVIELVVNDELPKLQADACHEFGHALGIKAHSPYRQDIMYVNRIVDTPSPADRATLRMLYSKQPKYWYY